MKMTTMGWIIIVLVLLPLMHAIWNLLQVPNPFVHPVNFTLYVKMIFNPLKRKERRESDFGRKYGWDIVRDGVVIGCLKYLYWDSHSQFWHEYQIVNLKGPYVINSPLEFDDFWNKCILVNKRYDKCSVSTFIPAPRDGDHVSMRGLFVEDKHYTSIA